MMKNRLFFFLGALLAALFAFKPWLLLPCLAAGAVWLLLRRRAAAVRLARADWLDAQSDAERALAAGDLKKALLLFEKADWLSPGEPGTVYSEVKILLGKARTLTGLGRPEAAVPVLKEAVARAASLPGAEAAALERTARDLLEAAARSAAAGAGPGA